MRRTRYGLAALATGGALLGGGVIGVSASGEEAGFGAAPSALIDSARENAESLFELFETDDERPVSPGSLDDGEHLLPRAGITLEQAVAAAQDAAAGPVGEVDLEPFRGRLVFNVDVGDRDVKVDATTGEVLAAVADD